MTVALDKTYLTKNYEKQGGAELDIGGTLNILSGGVQEVNSGASLIIDAGATFTVDPTVLNGIGLLAAAIVPKVVQATVARTDTSPKNLMLLPAHAKVLFFTVTGDTASDAATTATLAIGKTGTGTYFVPTVDVKNIAAFQVPTQVKAGDIGASPVQVIGTYAETGGASSTGGPWTVSCYYL